MSWLLDVRSSASVNLAVRRQPLPPPRAGNPSPNSTYNYVPVPQRLRSLG
jgi:hypothetical protein